MKRIFPMLALLFLFLFLTNSFGQTTAPTQVAKKAVGAPVSLTWDYPPLEEVTITNFEVRWVDDLTKTTINLKSVPKTDRSTSLPAFYTTGFKFTYFNVVAMDQAEVSAPSNTVGIQRVGPPPSNLRF
jgi:hypothetical protein